MSFFVNGSDVIGLDFLPRISQIYTDLIETVFVSIRAIRGQNFCTRLTGDRSDGKLLDRIDMINKISCRLKKL